MDNAFAPGKYALPDKGNYNVVEGKQLEFIIRIKPMFSVDVFGIRIDTTVESGEEKGKGEL